MASEDNATEMTSLSVSAALRMCEKTTTIETIIALTQHESARVQRGVQGEARAQQRGRAQEPRQGQGEAARDGDASEGADGHERDSDQEGGDAHQGAHRAARPLRQRGCYFAGRFRFPPRAILTRSAL